MSPPRSRGAILDAGHSATKVPKSVADVAELADALASGASGGNPVEVRVLSSAVHARREKGYARPAFVNRVDTGMAMDYTGRSRRRS